jgi:catechol 2,3-dioxygenase-like lactoylglutathione lyase family enzyme
VHVVPSDRQRPALDVAAVDQYRAATTRRSRHTGRMRPLAVHHVSINVDDVDAALRFYVDVLGMAVRDDRPDFGFGGAWLDVGGQQVHLIEAPPPAGLGQHFAVLVEDLDATIAELRATGLDVSDASPVASNRQAFVHDPAGNLVELHEAGRA